MPGIVGMGTTFNLPNFVGELFSVSPEDTPLLSAIGGLTGGRVAPDKEFEWEFYDLRHPDANRQRLEGANAPVAEERIRANDSNILEIHHEAVSMSYTKLSIQARGGYDTKARGSSPVVNEMAWQMTQELKQVARDVEKTFIVGQYAKPANNTAPRKTRGLLEAIATNVLDLGGGTLDEEDVNDLFQLSYDNGGMAEGETRVLLTGSSMKRQLTKIFIRDHDQLPLSRSVGGVNLQAIETDFGTASIMVDRYLPAGIVVAVSLEELAPRFLEVPGKGHFFWEPLAKIGSAENSQLYGEIGLEYGNERKHAKIVNAASAYDSVSS
jgi:hypothetical protein